MNKVELKTKQELKIFIDPLRQEILQKMCNLQKPVTAKRVADILGIAPSSAKHHLEKLRSIGIVAIDHTEKIHGIIATFYRVEDVDVTIGAEVNQFFDEKNQIARVFVNSAFEECYRAIEYFRQNKEIKAQELDNENKEIFHAKMIHSTIFLSQEEANELYEMVNSYLFEHGTGGEAKIPFKINIMAYDARENEK